MYSHRYHYAAFDMDGTLLDSMRYWRTAVEDYLRAHGQEEQADRLSDKLMYMSVTSGMTYIQSICEACGIPPMTWDELYRCMGYHYTHDVLPLPGVASFLQELRANGVKMCVATATPRPLAELALRTAGLMEYFSFILTPEDYPKGKRDRAVFDGILERFGSEAQDTALFEDALYSLKTAKTLGFYLVGIEDSFAAHDRDAIRALADEYYAHYTTEAQ